MGEETGVEEEALNVPFQSSFVARFKYVRVVKLCSRGSLHFLFCSCGHFNRCGIPCRHLLHIKRKYWNDDGRPQVTDIHPMWHANHKAYAFTVDKNGDKSAASAALEHYAKEFPNYVFGLQVPTVTPDRQEPLLGSHPDLDLLSAAERCVNWPTKLIEELLDQQKHHASGIPSLSQKVNLYTQESEDDRDDFNKRFTHDTAALQKEKEEEGDVVGALIPLTKELIIAVEKAPHALEDTCVELRNLIAGLNLKDEDEADTLLPAGSMVLPASKKKAVKRRRKV